MNDRSNKQDIEHKNKSKYLSANFAHENNGISLHHVYRTLIKKIAC